MKFEGFLLNLWSRRESNPRPEQGNRTPSTRLVLI